ncbi:formate acetyltransferase, partial [Klebsiella pneumoniae]
MVVGKHMQFFGPRANLATTTLNAINGGTEETLNMQVGPKSVPLTVDVLHFDGVMDCMDHFMGWLAKQYGTVPTLILYIPAQSSSEASLLALAVRTVIR